MSFVWLFAFALHRDHEMPGKTMGKTPVKAYLQSQDKGPLPRFTIQTTQFCYPVPWKREKKAGEGMAVFNLFGGIV